MGRKAYIVAGLASSWLVLGATSAQADGLGDAIATAKTALGNGNVVDILQRIADELSTGFGALLTGFCMLAGIVLVMLALVYLSRASQQGNRDGHDKAMWTFIIGVVLFNIPQAMDIITSTVFGSGYTHSPLSYSGIVPAQAQKAVNAAAVIARAIGWLSFVRGWFILRSLSSGQGGNANFFSASVFIFGGMLAANIEKLFQLMQGLGFKIL